MYEFKLPDVGEGISEAELVTWHVAPGDVVAEGDIVADIDTDKVSVELPAPASGTITELRCAPGDVVPVGTVILVIDTRGEPAEAAVSVRPVEKPGVRAEPPPRGGNGARAPVTGLGRVVAAPSTRRFAREQGVDLSTLAGSGPAGRILRADVERFLASGAAPAAADTSAPAVPTRQRLEGPRATAARRLAESVRTRATSTTTFEVMADRVVSMLDGLAGEATRRGIRLTPVAVVAKCVAAALPYHPWLNATVDEDTTELLLHPQVDLGVAVAAPSGLVVPVVRAVERRTLFDVAEEIRRLAERAREGTLSLDDVRGGSFTLSSTGGLEKASIVSTTPLINPPQTAILWVSRIGDRPRVVDGILGAGPTMVCSLSFDHRFIDGATATAFINDVASLLTTPEQALA